MRLHLLTLPLLVAAGMLASPFAAAQNTPAQPAGQQQPANEQVIVPQVDRRDVKLPRFPSKDFEAGLFAGTYQTENFGSNLVTGLRLGYHVTEDFFVEAAYAQTKVSDESFRQILPGGVFGQPEEKLTYYNLSVGYNLLPGEVFIGKSIAKANAIYLIAGIGSTKFNQKSSQTYNFGLGTRLMLKDWAAVQVDLRDHIFSMDLLGQRKSTQNLELTAGITFFF
jgi:outer membrane beta-barrel protein